MALHIFTGTSAPAIAPTKIGQHFIDTVGKISYISVGTASALDWKSSSLVQNNYSGTVPPGVNDDSSAGYGVGSAWVDTVGGVIYFCTDDSVGAAVWSSATSFDSNAIHVNAAGEIFAISTKATPIGADYLLTEDSADSNNKKKITISSLASVLVPYTGATANVNLGAFTLTANNFSGSSSGANTGDQTITLTGGVTGSGTGSFAATVITNANLTGPVTSVGNATAIANSTITNAMLVNGAVANLSGTNTGDNALNSNYTANPMTTLGDIILGGASGAQTRLGIGANTYVLTSDGTTASWAAATGGFADPMTTRGDLIYRNAANATVRLPAGANTYVLTSDGTDIAWAAAAASGANTTLSNLIATVAIPDGVDLLPLNALGMSLGSLSKNFTSVFAGDFRATNVGTKAIFSGTNSTTPSGSIANANIIAQSGYTMGIWTLSKAASSANSQNLYIETGNATGTTSDSGNLTLTIGTATQTQGEFKFLKAGVASATGQVWTASATDGTGYWANAASGFADPMTTRGDIIFRNASNVTDRLPVGANTYVLTSDGTDVSWAAPTGSSSPLTTKGDLYTYDTGDQRLGVGADGTYLIPDSAQATGLKYGTDADFVEENALTNVDRIAFYDASAGLMRQTQLPNLRDAMFAAPIGAEYLVVSLSGTLTAERALAGGAGVSFVDGGINSTFTINVDHDAITNTHNLTTDIDASAINASAFAAGLVLFSNGTNIVGEADFSYDTSTNTLDLDNLTFDTSIVGVGTIDLTHTATEADDHALEIDVNAAGFGDVKAVDIVYVTGAIGAGADESVILVNIDESLATGGDISALEVLTTTTGTSQVNAVFVGVGVNPIEQLSGTFGDATSVLDNAVNITTAVSSGGAGNETIFAADNDTLTIGKASKFEEIEFIFDTFSSGAGITPTFEYSTGVGTWAAFFPVDGTNGCRNNGVVAWIDSDISSWAVGTGSEYLIRITRTRNTIATVPILDLLQISSATQYFWDSSGNIDANSLTLDGNITIDDKLFFDAANGRLGVGTVGATETTITINGVTYGSVISAHAEGVGNVAEIAKHRHSSTAGLGAYEVFARSRGTEASETIVSDGDALGGMYATGFDGTDYALSSAILFNVDGTPGADQMGGEILFQTSPDGSQTLTTALTISNTQVATFANTIVGSISGNAATVTTNANLTGHITSTGNATLLGSFTGAQLFTALSANKTGTGDAVFATSPTLVTPNLGTPSTLVGTNITGTAAGLTAGTVTTNANLTGEVTSTGNAAVLNSTSISNKTTVTAVSGDFVLISDTSDSGNLKKVDALDFLSGGTTDHAALSSNLAWTTSGHTGTANNLAGWNGSNVAIVYTLSGTGTEVALTNSPTFITPALGTPSALVGTNITGTASGLTAGTVTTNANLTGHITSTGNATLLGSFTGAQLFTALSANKTGTGDAVFATSPTLVTPLLGTPTSGVLTNCTGLPHAGMVALTASLPMVTDGSGFATTQSYATLSASILHDSTSGYSAARHKLHPATSTDNAIARYDSTTGDLQNSVVIIADDVGGTADVSGIRDLSIRSTSYNGNMSAAAWGMLGIKVTGGVSNTLTDTSTAASGTVARATSVVLSAGSVDSTNSNVTYTEYFGAYAMQPAEAGGGNVTITNAYALGAEHIKVDCQASSSKQLNFGAIYIDGTTSYTNGGYTSALTSHPAVRYSATVNFDATPSFGGNSFLFWNLAEVNYTNADTLFGAGPNFSLVDQKLIVNSHGTAAKSALVDASFFYQPQFRATGSGTITFTSGHVVMAWPRVDSNVTFTRFSGFRMDNPTLTNSLATTTGAMTNLIGIEIADLTVGGTSNTAILFGANTPPPAGNWGIYQANTANNQWGGGQRFKRRTDTTTTVTITTDDHMVACSNTGTTTATLPDATTCAGLHLFIKKSGASGTTNLATVSSQTFNGIASPLSTSTQHYIWEIMSNGTNWDIIRRGVP